MLQPKVSNVFFSPIFEPGLPKEEDEPVQSGSFKYRKEVLRRRSEWAMSRANLQG